MATVYLASDLRHDRQVALKVLRPDLAAVIGASRFLAEIKTTANLQHPHILALHDSGEVDGTVFYVMPFVDGESLRDRLLREKQLPVDEAIRIAVDVAGALEYAHQHKVIHRDIKPENILLQGGHALVADFGIALAASRTEGGTRMTETGMSLGTPFYMSPEQAMGEREITAKSDVYALGCVLYEMLTGEPPFTGPTAQAIVARVMTEEPRSLTLQRKTIPRHVEAAVHRALSKLPADRFASAAEFAHALQDEASAGRYVGRSVSTDPTDVPTYRPTVAVWLAGAAAVIALAISGFLIGRRTAPRTPPRMIQLAIEPPDSVLNFTGRCCGNAVALSPDGSTLVFVGIRAVGGPLYRRSLGRIDAEVIPGTEGGSTPFFSPDGRWLGFAADGRLRKVSLAGGPALPITTAPIVSEASWGEGDVIVFGNGASLGLATVPAAGGQPTALTSPEKGTRHYAPSFLPGGKAVLFTMRDSLPGLESIRFGVVDLASKKVDTLGFGMRARYAQGYLVFSGADNTLLAQPFDPAKRRITGPAVAILGGLTIHGNTTHEFALSNQGGLVYQPSGAMTTGDQLRLAGAAGRTTVALPGRSAENLEDPSFSPDGRRIALRIAATGGDDIWLLDRQQGTLERFTVGGGLMPTWSHDGRRIAYSTAAGIYVKPADQTGAAELLLRGNLLYPGSWFPDGKSLAFQATGRGATRSDIGIIALGDTTPRWVVASEFRERQPQVSPNGKWLAYASDRTGAFEVYVQPLGQEGARVQVSTQGGEAPRWSPDGRALYYVVGNSIVAATLAPGLEFAVTGRRTVVENGVTDLNGSNSNWDIHPDGKQFLFIDETLGASRLVWILDWTELVRNLATAK